LDDIRRSGERSPRQSQPSLDIEVCQRTKHVNGKPKNRRLKTLKENDYTSQQLRDALEAAYRHIEKAKLITWEAISCGQDELEWSGEISLDERRIDAQAEFDGEVLIITVNDVLPRKRTDISGSLLRGYWLRNVVDAITRLHGSVHFERVLCSITVYGPRDVGWDVDNRAISYIVNALRAANVIPGDEWDKLSLLLLGGLDKQNPRTEIRLVEYSDDAIQSLFSGKGK
jgi:hypothetical protein